MGDEIRSGRSGLCRAYLDTDFVIKGCIANDEQTGRCLLDELLSLDYEFCCHAQIQSETGDHSEEAAAWLNKHIMSGRIRCISDRDELEQLHTVVQDFQAAVSFYLQFLKNGAAPFPHDIYAHYVPLEAFYPKVADSWIPEIESELHKIDAEVGHSNNLGEIKTNTAIFCDNFFDQRKAFEFYSDDRKARSGVLSSHDNISGFDLMAAFALLYFRLGKSMSEVEPFFNSYNGFMIRAGQPDYKMHERDGTIIKVNRYKAFKDIFDGKVGIRGDGKLGYR